MEGASAITTTLFALLVFVMAALVGRTLWVDAAPDRTGPSRVWLTAAFVLLYLTVPAILAWMGQLDRYDVPPAPLLLIGLLTIVTASVAFSHIGRRLANSTGLALLVGFQAFRIPVELLLHRLAEEGVIPVVMTYSGRNFDIVTGLSAAMLGFILMRRSVPRSALLAWNIIGLLLLANIVIIAALATPVSFRIFTSGPPNLLPSSFPYVWLPAFLVQLALFGHLLLFRRLRKADG